MATTEVYLSKDGLVFYEEAQKARLAKKVDKVAGKGLSANDFTAALKSKLDGISVGANNYTHPAYNAKGEGFYKVTVDAQGHISAVAAITKKDITDLGVPAQDTVYSHPPLAQ